MCGSLLKIIPARCTVDDRLETARKKKLPFDFTTTRHDTPQILTHRSTSNMKNTDERMQNIGYINRAMFNNTFINVMIKLSVMINKESNKQKTSRGHHNLGK